MAMPREVLTFQLGNYANYVGAHWWNIQESYFSYDEKIVSEIYHDALFREGSTFKGVPTFTPRTIVVDKRENAFHIPILDDTLDMDKRNNAPIWDEAKITPEYQSVPERHQYIVDLEKLDRGESVPKKSYNFEETVRSWCDYLKTRYHPRSLALLRNDLKGDIFHSGTEMFSELDESITEKIRAYLEECNNLQGFQILVDVIDAYGGLADHVMTHLRDEYPNKTIFTFPLIPSHYRSQTPVEDIQKMINILMAYQKFSEHSDLAVPLSTNQTAWKGLGNPINFPHLTYGPMFYHSSAIIASYLDTVSLKYRLKSGFTSLREITSGLNFWNRKICAAGITLPFPLSTEAYLVDALENYEDTIRLWNCLTPSCTIGEEKIFYQRITLRGVTGDRLRDFSARKSSSSNRGESVQELLHMFLSYHLNTLSDVTAVDTPLKTEVPFPQIFSKRISSSGLVADEGSISSGSGSHVLSCPVLAGLHSCRDVGRMLESLIDNVVTVNIRRFHHFVGSRMDLDEYRECLDKVISLKHDYGDD